MFRIWFLDRLVITVFAQFRSVKALKFVGAETSSCHKWDYKCVWVPKETSRPVMGIQMLLDVPWSQNIYLFFLSSQMPSYLFFSICMLEASKYLFRSYINPIKMLYTPVFDYYLRKQVNKNSVDMNHLLSNVSRSKRIHLVQEGCCNFT